MDTLDSREVAPLRASEYMFSMNTQASITGGLAIAVPAIVKGLYEAHKRYGRLPWKNILEPVIQLAKNGFPVESHLAKKITEYKREIFYRESLR